MELWMEKTDQIPVQEAGEAAYWGTLLEALVRTEFTKRTGIEVRQVNQLLQSEEYFSGKQNKNSLNQLISGVFWSCYPDLNWRPHPYQLPYPCFLL